MLSKESEIDELGPGEAQDSMQTRGAMVPPALVKSFYCALTAMTAVAVLVCPALSVIRSVMLLVGVPKV